MIRKLVCQCGSREYVQGDSIALMTVNKLIECLDCGDIRREKERKRQKKARQRLARGVEQSGSSHGS